MPEIPQYGIAARSMACYEVGGDYLDIVAMPSGETTIVVGDVAGKGLASALVGASFRSAFRAMVHSGLSLFEMPEIRDLGWKQIINAGSAGYVFDGDPTASWALIEVDGSDVRAEIRRAEFDTMAVANAISARGLAGDVYRAATVRTGKLVR